ncbi:MAG TPA: type VI secretion system tube protein Hcp [Terriglobales bacterium]|nr:type VI secretion system tube protein Hcp [Terriglobales bacterium]
MAKVDFFLKIDGIEGESTDSTHKGEIELLSFSWGAAHPVAGRPEDGGAAGKVKVEDFSFTADTGRASPELFRGVTTGKSFPTATVTGVLRELKEPVVLLKLEFKDVLISSYRINEPAEGDRPVDEAAFDFSQIKYTFTPPQPDGKPGTPVESSWDVKQNRPL